ncbi:class I SAM-dependent methyltransferase [Baaleninema sp.]|uniref:class I SAM-dependent methyltransferase n=1 Tax=Baaleninema sp. TaxID=3101197 RepID=UPI003CFF509E
MTPNSNPELIRLLQQRLETAPNRRISFAEYMETVLYHPQQGYYSRGAKFGAGGDFVTSTHLSADFGEMLAKQLRQIWEILGKPNPFSVVEMGAGQGILAVDTLRYLQREARDCFEAIEYIIVETSPSLRSHQKQIQGANLRWCDGDEIPEASIVGCFLSNELVDAFPVHRLAVENGQLREIYTTLDASGGFQEVTGELSTPQLREYFDLVGIDPSGFRDGYRTEVNRQALSWLETVANQLQRGYVLTVDYGYEAQRYYSPGRSSGTLQCYCQHRYHDNPYIAVGEQDITAHVDFTALQRQGEACGLTTEGFTQQGLFLMALGLGDRLAALGQENRPATGEDIINVMQRRQVLHSLIDPTGLGGFGVLVQSKGLESDREPLKGLTPPPMF